MSPILSSEFDDLMADIGYFEPQPTIAIATSGGADSMALLLLAKAWANAQGGKIIAITVNHNLRTEAEEEALQVASWCKKLGIEHKILHWEHTEKPISSIQTKAREARYLLLTGYCRDNNILHLLTAHHLDDQIETMFFRLARGSKLSGLSAMPAQTIIAGVRLLRPFLQIPKSRLIATLQINEQKWVEDPSNQNSKYERVHIRKQLVELDDDKSLKYRINNVINKLGKFRNILENSIASELTNAVKIYPMGYAFIDLDKNISEQSLTAIIQTINGEEHPPRSEKITNLYRSIYSDKPKSKHSLAGLIFEVIDKNKMLIYREIQAIEKPAQIIANTKILWDKRFLVESSITLIIRQLGSDGLSQIKQYTPNLLRNMPPARILRTIPSLWLLEELISIPHIGYMKENSGISTIKYNIKFYPAKPLAGSSFFVMNNQV